MQHCRRTVMGRETLRVVLALTSLTAVLCLFAFAADASMSFSAFELKKAGLYPQLEKRFGAKPTYTAEEVLSVEHPKPVRFTSEEVKTHFTVVGKLDPTKAHLYDQLLRRFGRKPTYSADEITAIEVPQVPSKQSLSLPGPKSTVDAFTAEQVREHFELLRSSNPKTKASMTVIENKYPNQDVYSAAQVRDVEKNGAEFSSLIDRPETPTTFVAEQEAKMSRSPLLDGWKTPLIRHDWTDVLLAEDATVNPDVAKTKVDDLVGASFSFVRDRMANTDTWTTVGALIWPWVYDGPVVRSWIPPHIVLAPSISINRIATNGNPKGEVDQVLYRFGIYGEWFEPFGHMMDLLQVRAAPVFGTNTDHTASMPGFEMDIEPSWLFNNSLDHECMYKIGFKNTLWPKSALLDDQSDQSVVDYQVRVWLHFEGGDIQDTGKSFAMTPGEFLRMGPVAQLRINTFFPVAFLSKGLSFTAQYSYLPEIKGVEGHDSLLNLSTALTILSDKANHQKLSLSGSYTRGGLNFTKQDVDTFTLGLSVLF